MANDNTLGAPTEGLGQTVTFAVGNQGGGPRMSAPQRQAIRNNPGTSQAIMNSRAQHVPDKEADRTFEILARLGGEILKPKLEAQRTEQYVKGMQAAAQRQGVTEIVDEQPWYSKIFGPTAKVDGARAYWASAKVGDAMIDIEENMGELREMSPTAFSKYVTERITSSRTGDQATDMMVMQQFSQRLPNILKSQSKNHLIYRNKELAENIGRDADTMMAKLGQLDAKVRANARPQVGPLPEKEATEEGDVLGAQLELSATMSQVPAGMDKTVHEKIIAQSVAKSLMGGNFAAFNTLKDSGQLDNMEIPVASAMRTAYRQAQAEARMNLPVEFSQKLSDLVFASQRGVPKEKIVALTDELNKEYTRLTGDPAKFRDSSDLAKDLLRNEVSFYQDQERLRNLQRTATTKVAQDQAKIEAVTEAAGRTVHGLPVHGLTEDQSRAQWAMATTKNPAAAAWMRVTGLDNDNIDKQFRLQVQNSIGSALGAVAPEDAAKGIIDPKAKPVMLHQAYMTGYLPLVQASGDKGEAAAQVYAGDYKDVMARYHKFFAGRNPATMQEEHMIAAYTHATKVTPPKPLSKEERKRGEALLTENPWFQGYMPAKNPKALLDILSPHLNTELDVHVAVPAAVRQLRGLNVTGGYHWWTPSGATSLQTYAATELQKTDGDKALKISHTELDAAFDYSVNKLAAEAGFGKIKGVHQGEDNKGVPYFLVENDTMVEGGSGKVEFVLLPGDKVLSDWNSRRGTVTPEKLQEAEKLKSTKPKVVRDPVTGTSKFEPFGQPR